MEGVTIFDNGGRTFDRYRVQFDPDEHPALAGGELLIGPTGNSPNGVCMWGDGVYPQNEEEAEISFADAPEPVQRAIANEFRLLEA